MNNDGSARQVEVNVVINDGIVPTVWMVLIDASFFSAALDITRANCHDLTALPPNSAKRARAPARAPFIVMITPIKVGASKHFNYFNCKMYGWWRRMICCYYHWPSVNMVLIDRA